MSQRRTLLSVQNGVQFPFHRLSELVSLFATIMLTGACGGGGGGGGYKYERWSYVGHASAEITNDRSRSIKRAILIAACAIISGGVDS